MEKAENAVKMVKRLFSKWLIRISGFTGLEEYIIGGNLHQHSTAFLGRWCNTLLPITISRLQPVFPTDKDAEAQHKQQKRQQTHYNCHVKKQRPIPTIQSEAQVEGDTIGGT